MNINDLDNRELRNVIELFSGLKINHLTIDDRGENIYFSSLLSDKEYVMELNIK